MNEKDNKILPQKKKSLMGLGKGLGALIPDIGMGLDTKGFLTPQSHKADSDENLMFGEIDINKISTNPFQPRKQFEEEALNELKDSIILHGVMQPIAVRRALNGYELISGERRLRASKLAGKEKIPAYILDVKTNVGMLELAIIENVQRENLNDVEVAYGYQNLIEECKLTQEEVALKVGKKRSSVANHLRLLKLPEKVLESLRIGDVSMGHARALLGIENQEYLIFAWTEVIDFGLSVRQTELLVKEVTAGKYDDNSNGNIQKSKKEISKDNLVLIEEMQDRLRKRFGTEVKMKLKTEESGSIEIDFYSKDDLERLLDLMQL
jgi:ParB family chromosome partitioning protein